ncbi:helix-turn-helix domain-containing protein [Deinococcus sp. QL22]|uniref:helix-turn-helix domain-containing protein n=1 Tax=Deinococcus sp. QL22 TaxID=2939437 RepID=UPI002017F647|nr:XRE family transcriptional regulator [Deinococcus sp. QL22]UQN05106.1 XRE family transcriptional regulator [Deinococcus sp. QL22]
MTLILDDAAAQADAGEQLAHCIRLEREARGWSQADLAQHSGVSKASISKIERGEMSPTAGTLVRLAGAYGLTLAGLLLRAEGHTGRLVRAADQPRWRDPGSGYERQQVFMRPDHPLEVVRVTLPPHQHVDLPASSYARIRQVVLLEAGALTVQEGPELHELAPGDSLAFGPPHDVTFRNPAAHPCTYLVVLARS